MCELPGKRCCEVGMRSTIVRSDRWEVSCNFFISRGFTWPTLEEAELECYADEEDGEWLLDFWNPEGGSYVAYLSEVVVRMR